tara:strand:+ start:366 stop:1049 length:684 start_codon:yes stop_codon:yes gene_type:complete
MALNLGQQITTPAQPNLGTPTPAYDQGFLGTSFGGLNVYFTKLTAVFATILGPRGGKYINNPYGAFQDTTDQTATANTATVMTFNTTDFANGVSVVTSGGKASRLTVAQAGIYNLQFSVQFDNSDTQEHDVYIWLRKDASGAGSDIPGSAGYVGIPSSHGGFNGHSIVGWNYFITLNANDFVEIWWSTPDVKVTIQAYAAGVSPTRPSTASVVATLSLVSNLSTETA